MRPGRIWLPCLLAIGACGSSPGSSGTPDGQTGPDGGGPALGVIHPTGAQADLDAALDSFYDTWKGRYLEPACTAGQYRIKTTPATTDYTVSEGHGYGMLATALIGDHDPDARSEFDGLYAYYAAHPSANDGGLMAWAQNASCADVDGPDSATDGDLDIAFALLLADARWGSSGTVDYLTAARTIIASILASEIHPANSILVGDWASAGDSHYDGTRPSDFMPDHFRAFAAASGVARWSDVVDKTYQVAGAVAGSNGLLPDFVVGASGATPAPAPSGWLEGPDDGSYAYNACRTPWRLATDYLVSGEPRARAEVRAIDAFIRGATGDDPSRIVDGYRLDGTPYGSGPDLAFVAPFAVAAMIEPESGSNQTWLDALWQQLLAAGDDGYYGDSIKLLSMFVLTGHWHAP